MKKKKLKNISFPTGYPYILFAAGKGPKYKYIPAATEAQALRSLATKAKGGVFPLSVSDAIRLYGHQKTNQLLSQFGETWMTKEGHVFYKELHDGSH